MEFNKTRAYRQLTRDAETVAHVAHAQSKEITRAAMKNQDSAKADFIAIKLAALAMECGETWATAISALDTAAFLVKCRYVESTRN